MADILIRGIERPKDGRITIQIGADGAVYFVEKCTIMAEKYEKSAHAIPLPEGHGDMMDKAVFEVDIRGRYCHGCDKSNGLKCRACWVDDMLGEVDDAPTIVPAEGGGEDG